MRRVLFLLLVFLFVCSGCHSESNPKGTDVGQLLLINNKDSIKRLKKLGSKATPGLLKAIKRPNNEKVRRRAIAWLGRLGEGQEAVSALLNLLKEDKVQTKQAALYAIGDLGAKAKDALPTLLSLLKSAPATDGLSYALSHMPFEAVYAPVLKALNDKSSSNKSTAVETIARMGPKADKAIPALLKALKHRDWLLQKEIFSALGRLGPKAFPALCKAAQTPKSPQRDSILKHLGHFKREHKQLIPLFQAVLKETPLDKKSAAASIQALALMGAPALPILLKLLSHKNKHIRSQTDRHISTALTGQKHKELLQKKLPQLLQLCAKAESDNCWVGLRLIAYIGPKATKAIPTLRRLATAKNDNIKEYALKALGAIGPQAAVALPALEKAAAHKESYVYTAALHAIAQMGDKAIPSLTRMMKQPKRAPTFTMTLTKIFRKLPPKRAIPVLQKALQEKKSQAIAIDILGSLGPKAKEAAPAILALQKDPMLRWRVAKALSKIAPEAGTTKAAVMSLFRKHKDKSILAHFVARLGTDGAPALPYLRKQLLDEESGNADKLALSFRRIGKASLPVLHKLLQDQTKLIKDASNVTRKLLAAIAAFGPQAAYMTPDIIRLSKRRHISLQLGSGEVFPKLGPTTVKYLIGALKSKDKATHQLAASGLSHLGKMAAPAVPALLQYAQQARRYMILIGHDISTLASIGPRAKKAVPYLLGQLEQNNNYTIGETVTALAKIQPTHPKIIPLLGQLILERPSNNTGLANLAKNIKVFDPEGTKGIPMMQALLRDNLHPSIHQAAAKALGQYGAKAAKALPTLRALLQGKTWFQGSLQAREEVVFEALKSIKKIGIVDQATKEILQQNAQSSTPQRRTYAMQALSQENR